MSVKLYKNTEGKVLMSVGNKLIKQPYNFGNAFQNRIGLNNQIEFSYNIGFDHTIVHWSRNNGNTNANLFNFRDYAQSMHMSFMQQLVNYFTVMEITHRHLYIAQEILLYTV